MIWGAAAAAVAPRVRAAARPTATALTATATRQRRLLPGELSHLVLFYTAGELVREVLLGVEDGLRGASERQQ